MNWGNFLTFTCPYDAKPLERTEDGEWIRCTHCTFRITPERFAQIKKHRTGTNMTDKKLKWQNLPNGKCPACSFWLEQKQGSDSLTCTNASCDFKIREERAREIMQDKNHPARRFGRDTTTEEENLARLHQL